MRISKRLSGMNTDVLVSEYLLSDNEIELITEEDDDETRRLRLYAIREALLSLDDFELIIFCLYQKLGSKTNVAKAISCSSKTISKYIDDIVEKVHTKSIDFIKDKHFVPSVYTKEEKKMICIYQFSLIKDGIEYLFENKDDIVEYLGCTIQTVNNWIRTNKIKLIYETQCC